MLPRRKTTKDTLSAVDNSLNTTAPTRIDEAHEAQRRRAAIRTFNKTQSGSLVKSYLDAIGDIQPMTAEEEIGLALKAQNGDQSARNSLAMSHLRLVASIAHKYKGQGIPMIDLLQEGNIGLMRAVDKFDTDKGIRFATYASWWIRESVTRALSNKSRTVRLPVHLNEFMTKLRRVRSELAIELGREPEKEEIAAILEVSVSKVEKALKANQSTVSLDQPVVNDEGEGCSLIDVTEDSDSIAPEERVNDELVSKQIDTLLEKLSAKEREVVRLRFGLGSDRELTLREVSEKMGLTRDQVGKLSCKAMRKLKKEATAQNLNLLLA